MIRGGILAGLLLLGSTGNLQAQGSTPAPLEHFVRHVAYLWSGGDAAAIASLMPSEATIRLDTGQGMEAVHSRHAAAALRALFSERENVLVKPVRVTISGGQPPRGFGELSWEYRPRRAPTSKVSSVYVGTAWTVGGWTIVELRLMP